MSDLVKAIQYILPDAEFTLTDDDYSTIVWNVEPTKIPTLADIDNAKNAIKAESEAKVSAKAALLERLGITAEEAALLLG
jgi:hypothetical protein